MKLREAYQNSFLQRRFSFLFSDNLGINFTDTRVGHLLSNLKLKTRKSKLNHAPYFLILTSIALLWYENPLEALWAPLGNDFLPFILLLASFFLIPKKGLTIRKYHVWYLAFLVSALMAGVIGVASSYGGFEMIWGWAVYAQFGLVLLLGNLIARENRLSDHLLVLTLPLLAGGLWQSVTGGGMSYSYLESAGTRIGSFVGNPNIFGFILVFLSLLVWQNATARKNTKWFWGLLPLLVLLILTGSRTAWLALGSAVLVIIVNNNWRYLLLSPVLLVGLFIPRVRERITIIFTPNYLFDASIDGRIWSIKNAIHIWSQNILGTGPGTYGGKIAEMKASPVYLQSMQNGYMALYTTDNQWLSILVQAGTLGTLSFMGTLGTMTVRLLRNKKAFGLALLAAFMVMMTFSNALEFGTVVVPMGLLLGKELAE